MKLEKIAQDVAPSTSWAPSSADLEEAGRLRRLHNRTGWLAIAGGVVRLLAYSLPWIVARSVARPDHHVGISGYLALGSPVLSLVYSIMIVVAGVLYLVSRREWNPRLLRSLGISSIIVFLIQFPLTLSRMGSLRTGLHARGIDATLSVGFGVWVELVGSILTLAAGLYAINLAKRSSPAEHPE